MSTLPAINIVATKQADGSTRFQVLKGSNTNTMARYQVVEFTMPSADTTDLNTTVFGGASTTTVTYSYAQAEGALGISNT